MPTYTPIRTTSTDGLNLYARDYPAQGAAGLDADPGMAGAIPARLPVVCLHGLTRNASDFHAFAPGVAALGRRVLVPDVRGRGHSERDRDPARYNAIVYAHDVAKLMADLGIGRAVFVGTSMGGLVTMMLADLHSELVAAAVLNDIGPVLAEPGLTRIAGYVGQCTPAASWEEAAARIKGINACAFPDYEDGHWRDWAGRVFEPGDAGQLVPRYDPAIALAFADGKRRTTTPELQRGFRRLAQERPTLLVRGMLSDLLGPEHAAAMRRAAPAMRYVEVPGVGHAPMLTEPAAFEAVAAFLAAVP